MIFYFSGTGNTRYVAEQVARETGDSVVEMARFLSHPELISLKPDEPVGIFFPVYGWDAPGIVYRTLECLQREMEHCPPYLYYICTMGDDIGITGTRLSNHVAQYGWQFQSGFSIQMPNTYVCLPGFDVDSDEVRQRKLDVLDQKLHAVGKTINGKVDGIFQLTPGSMPWLKTVVLGGFFRRYLMKDKHFRTTDACVGCGKCELACPVHNIMMEHGHPRFGGGCTMCLSCYHHCPHHAIDWAGQTRKKGQYVMNK